jgi:hypothetical protein
LDPRGELRWFRCSNKTSTAPIDTFGTLKIIKNGLELKNLRPPKVEGVMNPKKKPPNTTMPKFNHPKNSLYDALLLLEFKDDI